MIYVNSAAVTNVGKVRGNNEDNYYINGKYKASTEVNNDEYDDNNARENYIFAVCDGMGGEAYGELASLIGVETITKFSAKKFNEHIYDYIECANKSVCNEIENNDGARIGSTVALLYIDNEKVYGWNIGDSRIYIFRSGSLKQLSRDHTQAQSMVDMGLLKAEDMNSHKGKHKLTQHLGIFPDELIIQPYEMEEIQLNKDDVFILCSDGLTDMLNDNEIEEIVSKETTAHNIASKLVDVAVEKGGKDNTTVIALKITDITENRTKSFWSKLFDK